MKRLILISLIVAVAGWVFAQEDAKSDKPELNTGFTVFTGYFWNPSTIQDNSTNFNSFYFERASIDFKVDFKNNLKLRVTPDVREVQGSGWLLRLKYAYFDYKLLDIITLNGGITKTEWVGYVDDFMGTRYITKSAPDLYGIRSSADLGLGMYIKPIKGIQILASLYDGNGFGSGSDAVQSNAEYINVTKNLGTRFEFWPFYFVDEKLGRSLVAALFTYNTIIPSNDMNGAKGLEFYGAGVGVDFSPVKLFVDYATFNNVKLNVATTSGNYFELIGKLDFSFIGIKELALVGAYYIYEPNNSVPGNEESYTLGGIEYSVSKNLSVSINLRNYFKEDAYKLFDGTKTSNSSILYVNTQVKL
ncbi:MAG: hypothetical protein ACP5PT_02240 [Brevinematia bacterium]